VRSFFVVTHGQFDASIPIEQATAATAIVAAGDVEACCLFTRREMAERAAESFTKSEGCPWQVEELTRDSAREFVQTTAARHPSWTWTLDHPRVLTDPPGPATVYSTRDVLDWLDVAA
jgi:hypothetical protein